MALLDRIRYRLRMLRLGWTIKPMAGAEDPPPEPDPKKDDPEPDPKKDDPEPDPGKVEPDDDWKTKSRKNEAQAKRERREREKLEKELAELRDKDKSEQEKAIEKAREEARNEALTEADKERRADRLEAAVTRLALKGIEIGEGDEKKTVKFADSEDALLHIERAISRGDVDSDDIYDDEGKVKTDALTTALTELLERKPHLADGERPKPKGDPDTGKGDPASKDLEHMTPEDHAKRKHGAK